MPKKILLIENESAFAASVAESLEASGFDVRVTGDGKDGLDLAREWGPEAIVLCVELPGMSGYLVCQKLKKDDALKAIPLVLTSAEATQETFDKHRTLKARADEYLLKPYVPAVLLEKLGELVGLPEGAPPALEQAEELVSLEEEMGLEALPSDPVADLPALDLQSLPDEPAAGGALDALGADDDLSLLDDAFEGLAAGGVPGKSAGEALDLALELDRPVPGDEVDAAAASLPEEDEGAARADLGRLDDDAEVALGALGGVDEALSLSTEPEPEEPERPVRGASADLLRAAGITLLDDDPSAPALAAIAPPPPAVIVPPPFAPAPAPARGVDGVAAAASSATIARLERELASAQEGLADARGAATAREGEVRALRERADDATRRAEELEAAASEKDVELATLRARLDALTAQAKKSDGDLRAAREEARRAADHAKAADGELAELRRKLADAERRVEDALAEARRRGDEAALAAEATGKVDALERELDGIRTELVVARGEAEGARGEVERRGGELKKRISELEAANLKNEERVLKAYQKIKGDEKVKEKVRKAIAIASQLLEEGLPPEAPAEKPRSPAATLLGRDG